MKNLKKGTSKLSLNKFQISKINNPQIIIGGQGGIGGDDTDDTDNTGLQTK